MSLQVWLPLLGDLTNNGVGNPTISCNATVDNAGKIGKCYVCASGNHISFTNPITTSTTDFAISCWVYITEYTSGYSNVFSSRTATSGKGLALWIQSGSIRFDDGDMWTVSNTFTLNTWTHICVTYSKTKGKAIYVNGNLIGSKTTVGTLANLRSELFIGYDHHGYYLGGKINDLRVWEGSTPSPKEVEILARGLVLHYPMTGGGRGQDNLHNFESVASNWKTGSKELIFVDATDDVYGNVLKIIVDSVRIYHGVTNVWKADTNFTVSFLAKASKTAVLKIERSRTDYAPDVTVGTTWKRYSTVISCTATTTGGALGITSDTAGADIYLTQIKVELGDKATAYCPGVHDSHYNPMGYNDNIEYDVSGYNHHGIKNGSVIYSSDAPRYSISTHFDANSAYIRTTGLATTGFGNSYSFAWWAKMDNRSYMHWGFQDGIRLNGMLNGNLWNTGDSANNPLYKPGTTTQVDLPTYGVWHHWVMTGDGTTCKVYQDGVLWAQAKTYKAISGTSLIINGWDTSTSYSSPNYSISDFRIYATALSATQVAELYNTAVSLSNNGALLGYEFVEN